MSLIYKIFSSIIVATCISVFSSFFTIYLLSFIVEIFRLNYNKDSYWVFSVSFYIGLVFWIISFALSINLIDK